MWCDEVAYKFFSGPPSRRTHTHGLARVLDGRRDAELAEQSHVRLRRPRRVLLAGLRLHRTPELEADRVDVAVVRGEGEDDAVRLEAVWK